MSSTAVLPPAYEAILEDPELNAKVRKVVELLKEHQLTPAHAIFAVALAFKHSEGSCPCANATVHRITSLDEVCGMFLDAYDSAVKVAAET